MKPSYGRLLVVGSAVALVASTLSGWWVSTVLNMGGQGSLRVYGGATPWEGYFLPLLLLPLGAVALAAAVACVLVVRPRLAGRVPECQLYLALGLVGAGAMALTLWNGPGGAYLYETGSLTTRSGPLALVALPLAASPMVAALLLWPWRRPLNRPLTALATVIVLAVLAVAFSFHSTVLRPAAAGGPIPDWRSNPDEPYPFSRPVPPLVPTRLDGLFDRTPTETYPGGVRPHCTRCQPYPPDAGRSTLTLDRGRYRVEHVRPTYRSGGHFAVAGTHITFFNDPECGSVRGVYRWKLVAGRLTLSTLFDPCGFDQRARDLTDAVWESIPS